jgi:hypothetical protein
MNVYLLINNEVQGPFAIAEVQARLRRGELPAGTQYAVGQSQDWHPVAELRRSKTAWLGVLIAVLIILGVAGAAGAFWIYKNYRTPSSTEPPPPNVSYKKWEKTSNLYATVPPTEWEQRLGRNWHRVAYQAATNLVCQTLNRPETARFVPFAQSKVTGKTARFLVEGHYQAVTKGGELRQYDYRIFLKHGSNDIWTIEYLDKIKLTADGKSKDKAQEPE